MTATKSIAKPNKPYEGYPLFAATNGQWCKKYKGKRYQCGPWADPTAALSRWHEIRNHLEVGNQPPAQKGDLTIEYVCNAFLDSCHSRVKAGDLYSKWMDFAMKNRMYLKQDREGKI